jgi:hypothetical protein
VVPHSGYSSTESNWSLEKKNYFTEKEENSKGKTRQSACRTDTLKATGRDYQQTTQLTYKGTSGN